MTEPEHTAAENHGADDPDTGIERALAESQRLEREERDAAIKRQLDADERVVRLLTEQ